MSKSYPIPLNDVELEHCLSLFPEHPCKAIRYALDMWGAQRYPVLAYTYQKRHNIVSVRLNADDVERAKAIGGNVSKGIRRAIQFAPPAWLAQLDKK